ncbi:MAG: phenylacetate-CoA oxygenase subunit PaaI, partial [Bacteroidetes bacterium]
MNTVAIKDLLYKIADDQLILGHRSSEWIGLGPLLEEDIAFASKAQDKVGQSLAFYKLLETMGESEPDITAFSRSAHDFHNSTFVELPNGEFDFSIIRHFLFDTADFIRFELLSESTYHPLANLAKKFQGEIQYHILHANEWMKQLGDADNETTERMQAALDYALPYALGVFELSKFEDELIGLRIFRGEEYLQLKWQERISEIIGHTQLSLPEFEDIEPAYGGRYGDHT